MHAASELGIACMKAGAALQGADGAMALEARPVVASKPICLRCHANRKLGDVLGSVITAFVEDRAVGPSPGE